MYDIGDKVVYPMHGAGIIESIEKREIMGEMKDYYVLRIPVGDMKVMVPVDKADEVGLREVIEEKEADNVLKEFKNYREEQDNNWNKRYRDNMTKIKSGDIYEVVRVVKSLMYREMEKGLSTGEHKMLSNAKQILISELVVAKKKEKDEIEKIMTEIIKEELA
ncbi:MAG: CarD family transcriptional regulator [Ruminococcaceae bacterium]|nr:CarD family transcriptional regulator [Oscillospiraceae bacterium]